MKRLALLAVALSLAACSTTDLPREFRSDHAEAILGDTLTWKGQTYRLARIQIRGADRDPHVRQETRGTLGALLAGRDIRCWPTGATVDGVAEAECHFLNWKGLVRENISDEMRERGLATWRY